jgi:hypothetical protein
MPRFALHAAIFALSATEDDDDSSSPLVVDDGGVGGASLDTDCLWSAYNSRRSRFFGVGIEVGVGVMQVGRRATGARTKDVSARVFACARERER